MFKRFLSMFLSLLMIIGVFPVTVFATEEEPLSVSEMILHEQITVNCKGLEINVGRDTEGILAIGVDENVSDKDLEDLYVGNPLNCTFVDYLISVPAAFKDAEEIKFVEFWDSDVRKMEEINIGDDWWNTYVPGELVPGGMVVLATKDSSGNIVREPAGETWSEYGVVWLVDGVKYYQRLDIVREIFGENNGDGNETESFSEWWANAPKVPMERIDLSYFDVFKANGQVDIDYSNGVLDITIRNNNPDDWAAAYNAKADFSFGGKQEELIYEIIINGVEGTEFVSNAKMGNANGHVMAFEQDPNKDFYEGNACFSEWGFATIDIEENGSALVIPEDYETIDRSQRITCMAWEDANGNVTYEYIEVKVRVAPEETVIDIPEGKLSVSKKISEADRLVFDQSFASFVGSLDAKKSTVYYSYAGNETTLDGITKEIDESGKTTFTTVLKAKEGYTIVGFETINGLTSHVLAEDGKSLEINSRLAKNGNIYTNDTILLVVSLPDGSTSFDDLIFEKIILKNIVNITWMANEGFEPMPVERFAFFADSLEKIRSSGVNVDLKDGELRISYNGQLDMEIYNSIYCMYQIVPPEDSTHHCWSQVGGPNPDNYYNLNYSYEEGLYDPITQPVTGSWFGISELLSKEVGDVTYYYSGPAGYYAFIAEWYMNDGSAKREYFKLIFEEYINTVTTEGITESQLGSVEIENPTVVKDKFNHGYHGNDWRFTAKYYPQESADGKSYYFELEIKGEGSENIDEYKRVYLPYNFISTDMDYEKAVEENLSVKIIHYLDSEHKNYEELVGTPDEYGIYFDVKTFSPFVMEWEFGDEQEEAGMPESTPVADQKLTVWYVEGSTYKRVLAEADIVDGKVKVTVPYITDAEVKSMEADGNGRKRARLAFCINDGYDGENADSVTHFMGGLGNNILDYVNWREWAKEYDSFEEFLYVQYWEIEQFGDESVVKYEVARDTNGEMRRWIEPGETLSERLYIQYFDGENKEAVAYEYFDVTLNVEDVYPTETQMMPFRQVEINGYEFNSEEIGYDIGVNTDTNELIVEMSMEQLWAKEGTQDENGNIYNVFEFSAPGEGNYKYAMAIGADEIFNMKNLTAEDFENEYDPENKPEMNFVIGWFDENGEFYQTFEGEKKTSVCFAWYDGTDIIYQSFKLVQWTPEHEDENGPNIEGYLPDNFYDYWDESELITSDQIEVTAHSAIIDYLDAEFNDEGVLVITVNNIPTENWELAYNDLPAGDYEISVIIEIDPPKGNIVAIAGHQGNGSPTVENLKNQYAEDPDKIEYHEYDGRMTAGNPVGEVLVEGKKVSVFPSSSGGAFYRVIFWKDAEGNVIQQILPFVIEVADDARSVTFENGKSYIPESRIEKDGRTSVLSGSYDSEQGVLKYSYIGTKTSDADIADDIRFGYGENDPVYAIQTRISAPEEGYITFYGEEVVCFNIEYDSPEYPLRGSENSFEIEWFHETKEPIKEVITIEFDPGKIWLDKYWTPITDSSRLIYYSITNGYELMSAKNVRDAGVILDLFQKPGKINTRFDEISKIDIEKIANLEAWILPPDAVERKPDESLSAWIKRVYSETEYVGSKVGATGVGVYDPERADDADQSIRAMRMEEIGRGSEADNIACFGELMVDDLRIWFSTASKGGDAHVVYIDWYKEGETEPSVREYLYNEQEKLVVRETANSVPEEELTTDVKVPTPADDSDWVLTTNHFAQVSRYEEVTSYYFQLEGDENTPEGDKVIYLPYSFVNPFNEYDYNKDGVFDYSDAVAIKLKPKIHHYDDDHKELETIKGELTPYGIRFVVSSFSPFVLDWSDIESVDMASWQGNIAEESEAALIVEGLSDVSGFVSGKYVDGIYTINVDTEKITEEQWQIIAENCFEGTASLFVGLKAPEGTKKAVDYASLTLENYADYVERINEENWFFDYNEENATDFCVWNGFAEICEDGTINTFEYSGEVIYYHMTYVLEGGAKEYRLLPFKVVINGGNEDPGDGPENPGDGPEGDDDALLSWQGNIAEETEASVKVKGLSDISGFVSGEYVDGVYTITVTPENITTEQWQQMYKNALIDQQDIYLWVGVNAPSGTTKAYDNSREGLKNYNDFAQETGNANAFYNYNEENAIEFHYAAPLAGTVKNGDTITAFPEDYDVEWYYQVAFYVEENNEIVRRILPFRIVFEGDVESVSFEEPRNYVSEERLHPENNIDDIDSSYNEINGDLVYIYSGSEKNKENIIAVYKDSSFKTVIDAPVIDGKQYYSDGKTSVEIYYEPVRNGDLYTAVSKEEIVWENEDGEQYIEYISLEFNPKVTYMDIYWEQITDTDRIEFVNKKGETVTAEALAKDGLNVSFDENGFVVAEYDLDLDPETVTRTWVKISKPEGEFVGYKTINFMQNFTGYPSYDVGTADYRDEDIRKAEFQPIGNGTVLGMLGELDSLEVGDITFWYANEQGASRPVLIDWYKKLPTDSDFDFERDVVREYVYVQGSDFVFEETANSVTEDELTVEVEVPTPVDDIEWKLTTNHFPQVSRYEEVSSYYFQLEGDENTPEGDKVIYLPYSFVNPYNKYDFDKDGDFDYSDAVALKLNPKIHHYSDDFEESETIQGELTPYGIRFVVSSFSPFVLDWSESGNSAVIGDKAYETLAEALEDAKSGDVVVLLGDAEEMTAFISEGVTLDLNGYSLAAEYVAIFGDIVDGSDDNSGRLVVDEEKFMSNPDNAQLPIKTESGYAFVELNMLVAKNIVVNGTKYDIVFEPRFEAAAVELLENNVKESGIKVAVVANWKKNDDICRQNFVFSDEFVTAFVNSYNAEKGKFGKMFTLKITNAPEGIFCKAQIKSSVGISITEKTEDVVN